MPLTLTDKIASWDDEGHVASETPFAHQDGIATESQQLESPTWEICIDALLQIWSDSSSLGDPHPNRTAIEAAIAWLIFLRKRFPYAPPSYITPEPDGGIIFERRVTLPNGNDCLCEMTFYNNGSADRTDYFNGRITQMSSIPHRPPGWDA